MTKKERDSDIFEQHTLEKKKKKEKEKKSLEFKSIRRHLARPGWAAVTFAKIMTESCRDYPLSPLDQSHQDDLKGTSLPRLNFSCAWSRLEERDPQ